MRVSVFGLGYVGCVTAACLAGKDNLVVGVDSDPRKVARIRRGVGTVIEPGLDTLVATAVRAGRLTATVNYRQAVADSDISLVCVGTPSADNGYLELGHLETVCRQIGDALTRKRGRHLVAVRSTATPGTAERLVIPTLEKSSERQAGNDLAVVVNPEFMREGTSVHDFHNPPFTIIGAAEQKDGEWLRRLYDFVDAPVIHTTLRVAESVKLVCNTFHGLKIAFANEIGNFAQAFGIDGHEVMSIICRDHVLNISPKYLKPGFAFGGSCLPKDISALVYEAKRHDIELPLVRSILPSNRLQIMKALDMIVATGKKRVGIVGLSVKEGTDDLRQSPMVQLVEMLIGKGYQLKIYDPVIRMASIVGANRRYIRREIPHISSLMTSSFRALCRHADVLVMSQSGQPGPEGLKHVRPDQTVIDLVRMEDREQLQAAYRGISW